MNTTSVIRARGLTKQFRTGKSRITAVAGVDLSIDAGEIVAFLGPNGAGKTTTVDMLLGLTSPTSGNVELFGGSARGAVRQGRVSAVLQNGGFIEDFTVEETLRVIASCQRKGSTPSDVMERIGLTPLAKRRVSKLSGGERQKLRFAMSLLSEPDLLILDEPTVGMDVTARRDFWDSMHAEALDGRTVVFATHYLAEAEEFAQRVVVIHQGRIVADGPLADIRRQFSVNRVEFSVDVDAVHRVRSIVEGLEFVQHLRLDGTRFFARSTDSDALARIAITQLQAHDLVIEPGSLDDAFIHLTTTEASAA